jgi:uncharacterized protein YkwD/LysM repeat protein
MRFWNSAVRGLFLVALLAAMCTPAQPGLARPQASSLRLSASGYDVIDLVNGLRSARGLTPLRVNDALMSAAQGHSNYQAAIGTITHTGRGGSRPRDRAAAAGFGGGGTIFISENIAGGTGLSAAEAVQMWQGDDLHLYTMLNPAARDAGAGVAEAGGVVYYTLDTGYAAGDPGGGGNPGSGPTITPGGPTRTPSGPPTVTPILIIPVVTVTPRPDGSIIHVVQPGQALWNVAAAYKVALADLLAWNGLTERSVIHPGDKLLVRPAQASPTAEITPTLAATAPLTPTITPSPSATLAPPTATLTPPPAVEAAAEPAATPPVEGGQPAELAGLLQDPFLLVVGILVVAGSLLVVLGGGLRGKAAE